ncbi:hypothetical protein IQ268_31600 [Oculatella sp. LEGE 06141]|nr:hypothetical protein [Oculatella sp. LEGE 06141]
MANIIDGGDRVLFHLVSLAAPLDFLNSLFQPLEQLRQELIQKNSEIAQKDKEIAEKNDDLKRKNDEMYKKEQEIKQMNEKLTSIENRLNSLKFTLDTNFDHMNNRITTVSGLNSHSELSLEFRDFRNNVIPQLESITKQIGSSRNPNS